MRRRAARGIGVALGMVGVSLVGCSDGGADSPDPADLAGSWDVTMVVGAADTAPDIEPGLLPGDTTFREHWRFEACDETGCTLRRPDGGVLLGDLDAVRVALEGERLVGEGSASNPPPVEDPTPCDAGATQRWTVDLDLDVDDGVLSGSIVRTAEVEREVVDGRTCFGIGLSLGFSGVPRASGTDEGQG